MTRHEIVWILTDRAQTDLAPVRAKMSEQAAKDDRDALQDYLCSYFDSGACIAEQGRAISPVGATPMGGKKLKVRWKLPGNRGKSAGLRLAIVAFCNEKRVVVGGAWPRIEDPDAEDFDAAASSADSHSKK